MKKIYSKPEIMFEDFALSESIAGDCETKINNQTRGSCAYILRTGEHVFTGISACTTDEQDGDYNGICYHVPIDTRNLFNS